MSTEQWKKFNSFLEVSNFGNVRFTKSKAEYPVQKKYNKLGVQDGYRYIVLANLKYPKPIHRIVAKLFVDNPCPKLYKVVDHLDRDRSNNYFENLKWVNTSLNNLNKAPKGIKFKRFMNGWRALLRFEHKNKILGYFKTYSEAFSVLEKEKQRLYQLRDAQTQKSYQAQLAC